MKLAQLDLLRRRDFAENPTIDFVTRENGEKRIETRQTAAQKFHHAHSELESMDENSNPILFHDFTKFKCLQARKLDYDTTTIGWASSRWCQFILLCVRPLSFYNVTNLINKKWSAVTFLWQQNVPELKCQTDGITQIPRLPALKYSKVTTKTHLW